MTKRAIGASYALVENARRSGKIMPLATAIAINYQQNLLAWAKRGLRGMDFDAYPKAGKVYPATNIPGGRRRHLERVIKADEAPVVGAMLWDFFKGRVLRPLGAA